MTQANDTVRLLAFTAAAHFSETSPALHNSPADHCTVPTIARVSTFWLTPNASGLRSTARYPAYFCGLEILDGIGWPEATPEM